MRSPLLAILTLCLLAGCDDSDSKGRIAEAKKKYSVRDEDASKAATTSAASSGPKSNSAAAKSASTTPSTSTTSATSPSSTKTKSGVTSDKSSAAKTQKGNAESQKKQTARDDESKGSGADRSTSPEQIGRIKRAFELAGTEPSGSTRQEKRENFIRSQESAISELALAIDSDELSQEDRRRAIVTIIKLLGRLGELGVEGADVRIARFSESLLDDDDPQVRTIANVMRSEVIVAQSVSSDPPKTKPAVKSVLDTLELADADPALYERVLQWAKMVEGAGDYEGAVEILEALVAKYAETDVEEIAESNRKLTPQLKLLKIGFPEIRQRALAGDEKAIEQFIEISQKLVSEESPSPSTFDNLSSAAINFEYSGNFAAASQVFKILEASFDGLQDDRLQGVLRKTLEAHKKRASLIGKPFVVEGTRIDGVTLDWSEYKGKVVLVDFWATWCQPCVAELPNIRKVYRQFHDEGFEVIGISVDEELGDLEEFVKRSRFPWDILSGRKEDEMGFNHPMARKCGVLAIPFMVLVGRDGNVAALHTRGPALEKAVLAELAKGPAQGDGNSGKGG